MTQPNIPSMSRGQLIEYIEGMGAQYAADDTTPLHAAAAMVAEYQRKTNDVYRLSRELDTANRTIATLRIAAGLPGK